jgi:hypothetical protein
MAASISVVSATAAGHGRGDMPRGQGGTGRPGQGGPGQDETGRRLRHKYSLNQPLSGTVYLLVSVGLMIGAATTAVFILNYTSHNGETSITDLVYYITVMVLGLAAASFLFGVMSSYASYRGKTQLGSLELSGPPVVAALVMAGFFYIHHVQENVHVKVLVTGPNGIADAFSEGFVTISLDNHREQYFLNRLGEAYIWDLKPSAAGQTIAIHASIPGYQQKDAEKQYTLKPEGFLQVETIAYPEPDIDKIIPDAILQLGGKLNYKFTSTEIDALKHSLLEALNFIKPQWTYFRNNYTDLVA